MGKKRYVLTLGESDLRRLDTFAEANALSRPVALRRLVKQGLKQVEDMLPQEICDEHQLSLFDTIQIDIFDNTSKSN